jgi:hypothetical protein
MIFVISPDASCTSGRWGDRSRWPLCIEVGYCAIENLKRPRRNQSPGGCDGESLKPGKREKAQIGVGRMLMGPESDWS